MRAEPRSAPGRSHLWLAPLVCLGALSACAADREARATEPASHESRTGVPMLMDLPLIGWLFQHRVTAR